MRTLWLALTVGFAFSFCNGVISYLKKETLGDDTLILMGVVFLLFLGSFWKWYNYNKKNVPAKNKNTSASPEINVEIKSSLPSEFSESLTCTGPYNPEFNAKYEQFRALFETEKTFAFTKDWDNAILKCEEIISFAHNNPEISISIDTFWKKRGDCLLKKEDFEGAIESYQAGIGFIMSQVQSGKKSENAALAERGVFDRAIYKAEQKIK